MNFIDLIYQHNLESLSTPLIVKSYKSLIADKKDKFLQQLFDVLENNSDKNIIINGKLIDGSSLREFMAGTRDDVLSLTAQGNSYVSDIDDQIQTAVEEFSVLSNFLDALSVQANSAIERATYFTNAMQLEDVISNGAVSLIDYYRDILLNATSVNSALDVITSDISDASEVPGESSQAFEATGENPFMLMLNSIDLPEINWDNIGETITQVSNTIKQFKLAAKAAATKAVRSGVETLNTTFVDTIDFEIKSEFDDLSCDQSSILIAENNSLAVDNITNTNNAYYNVAKILKQKEDDGYSSFSFAVPTIGSTLYFVSSKYDAYRWSSKVYLKKHIYSSGYSASLLSTLLDCVSRNDGATATIESLSSVISGATTIPDTFEGSIGEGLQYLSMRTTESLIMLGLLLLRYGNDNSTCYQQIVDWYRQDGSGNYSAQYAFRINYGISGLPSTINNLDWYNEANYISPDITSSIKLTIAKAISDVCPGSITFTDTNTGNQSPVIAIEISEFLKGVLSIKSDEQLVAELKTVLGMIAATAAAVSLAVIGVKLKVAANRKYITALSNYKNLLSQPNPNADELIAAFKYSNRWSKIASRSLVRSSSGWYVSAPSATALAMNGNINDISHNLSNTNASIATTNAKVDTLTTNVGNISTGIDEVLSDTYEIYTLANATSDKIEASEESVNEILTAVQSLSNTVTTNHSDISSSIANIVSTLQSMLTTLQSDISTTRTHITNEATGVTSNLTTTIDVRIAAISTAISLLSKLIK